MKFDEMARNLLQIRDISICEIRRLDKPGKSGIVEDVPVLISTIEACTITPPLLTVLSGESRFSTDHSKPAWIHRLDRPNHYRPFRAPDWLINVGALSIL